jgi:hypothetical protein
MMFLLALFLLVIAPLLITADTVDKAVKQSNATGRRHL